HRTVQGFPLRRVRHEGRRAVEWGSTRPGVARPGVRPMRTWEAPRGWRRITTLESHAAGEPLRIVTGGVDPIPGRTILEKRRYAREHLDGLRRAIVFEPRGHA